MTTTTAERIICNTDIINAKVPGYQGLQMIWVNEQGSMEKILPMTQLCQRQTRENLRVMDLAGDWVSLGGVDLQINGGLGLAFPDLTGRNIHRLQEISDFLWEQGVDAYLPTLVTTSIENIHRSLDLMANYEQKSGAKILGVHLEGPFLNYGKRGAHPAEYLLPLTMSEVNRVLGDYASLVKVITLAPELDPTGEVIPYLRSLGITVSLGHSLATAAQADEAFRSGATMVTHAFNAMPPLHHREPGLLGAAMNHPHVMSSFIADGQHIVPPMLEILLRASKGLFLVSDALAPLGLPDGEYPWDSRKITVKNGTARLADGTLSGTTFSLLKGVQKLVQWQICDIETGIFLATDAPRKAINLPTIGVGVQANLLHWFEDQNTGELTWKRIEFART
ncbi:N-acetylglucosamine-6-phosphate deacetylase [Cylindrospermopsis raciborskii]|uniref:N-acetylglucosamine-6-phosphate deacetylase n=1 Tax=Cylindrospermopsis raciborskii CENA302 TaxID=1170768 RepID=A0A9Q5WAR6_9CYAN|nr:N-acetylglucosamine-6-phosphate deacetylase [Cylindrospermopsis raciborskii]MCZ2201240.1 N-acetylglucosamine-6-phosphate deacetylase [Cylindrospermopsis raciborskii PAMP2012]MCZ2205143.1 N-acetylglucosamine-6-phosphate deacetylase [Cylindrospermopsis raciborskii PAMP2011]NLQ06599.1 N-acetylglucosamine-6-phosphate deacetylase [Cylindrospermopsis raciborskii MVCC19]OHY34318.1 N-acetylglucosamine-6-phosphate deacetylase [Cylindrospermopsis raciborskii MVCC14]OPH10842.1 N-acetylglucosamine-6-ph